MNRVVLSKADGEWFYRNILKTMTVFEAASKSDPEIKKRTTYRLLKSLKPKALEVQAASEAGAESHTLMLSKKQKRGVQDMIDATFNLLSGRITTEYERRGRADKLEEIKVKTDNLKAMSRKFK